MAERARIRLLNMPNIAFEVNTYDSVATPFAYAQLIAAEIKIGAYVIEELHEEWR